MERGDKIIRLVRIKKKIPLKMARERKEMRRGRRQLKRKTLIHRLWTLHGQGRLGRRLRVGKRKSRVKVRLNAVGDGDSFSFSLAALFYFLDPLPRLIRDARFELTGDYVCSHHIATTSYRKSEDGSLFWFGRFVGM